MNNVLCLGQAARTSSDPGPGFYLDQMLSELLVLHDEIIMQLHFERLEVVGSADFPTSMIDQHEKIAAMLQAQIASPPSVEIAAAHGVRQAFVFTQPNAVQLAELAKLADADKLKTIVETILPLSDATRGQELVERGHTRGKIVLRVV